MPLSTGVRTTGGDNHTMTTRVRLLSALLFVTVGAFIIYVMGALIANQLQYRDPLPTWQDKAVAGYVSQHGQGLDPALILSGVNDACGLMTEGASLPETWDALVALGYGSDQSTTLIALGITYRCTELQPLLEAR